MKPVKIILVLMFILFLTGCKKNYVVSEKQTILFQMDYINYTWGYQHNGFLIDNEGNVYTYDNPDDWNFPDNDFSMDETQVAENISKCIKTNQKISKEELQKFSAYIKNIASSKISGMKSVSSDAGSLEYICYLFSESTGRYKGTLIKMEGDFTCENLNFFSKKVASWMRDVNGKL
jgi:hypothetical protein